MSILIHAVEWDGEVLTGSVTVAGAKSTLRFSLATIRSELPAFNDAVSWEIERHRVEIFEKLIPLAARHCV